MFLNEFLLWEEAHLFDPPDDLLNCLDTFLCLVHIDPIHCVAQTSDPLYKIIFLRLAHFDESVLEKVGELIQKASDAILHSRGLGLPVLQSCRVQIQKKHFASGDVE